MTEEELKDLAQAQTTGGPQPGEHYRHYKGGRYIVFARALREDDLTPVVVYRSLLKGYTWVRNLSVFTETVTVAGEQVPRFARIDG